MHESSIKQVRTERALSRVGETKLRQRDGTM